MGNAIYRALLLAYPRSVRERDGAEMARHFADERAASAGRPLALAGIWMRGVADVLWYGLLARCAVESSVMAKGSLMDTPETPQRTSRSAALSYLGDGLLRDLRIGGRRLLATPTFTLVGVITLALGIGANSTIFGAVHAVLLQPLPYPDSSRLVSVLHLWKGERDIMSPPNFLDAQARTKTLSSAAAYDTNGVVLTGEGEPVSLTRADVTAGFFETLGTPPLLGRVLKPGENEPGQHEVVVLSHRLWQQRFNGDLEVVGRSITLHGRSNEVVGVMPPEFDWPIGADLWAPVEYDERFTATNRGAWYLEGMGRLAPGVTIEEAQAEFSGIAAQLEQEHPGPNTKVGLAVYPLLDGLVGGSERGLLVLLAAVGFVLLIACANVANLLLARASARRDELSVRLALGAGRGHLVRQLVVEGLLLAAAGGAAGLMLAAWATRSLATLALDIPRLDAAGVSGTMLAFTLGATCITGVLFSLAPSLLVTGRTMAGALNQRGRSGTGSRRSQRLRSTLVVVETALAVILLAGAGLLIRSFVKLSHVDPGFDTRSAITFRVSLPEAAYDGDEARVAFYDGLRERVLAVPGVTAVATTLAVPPAGQRLNLSFDIAGQPPHAPGTDPTLEVTVVDADYFGVMGIPVVRGRGFTADDRLSAPTTLVLTESAVRRYFPDEDPLGQHITLGWRRAGAHVGGEVVGVVRDVRSFGLDVAAPPQVYVSLSQVPIGSVAVIARTGVDSSSVVSGLRAAVSAMDASIPLTEVGTLEDHVRGSIAQQRLIMALLSAFAAVALVLAAVGIFGVLSYLVSQRTREIGLRMALGASRQSVVGLVLRRAVLLSGAGVAIGTLGALALSRTLQSLLFDLSATDPVTFFAVPACLMAVALFASWLPARRATGVDPLTALRE